MPTPIIIWLKQRIKDRELAKKPTNPSTQPIIQSVDGSEEFRVIQASSPGYDEIYIHLLRLNLCFSNETTIQIEIILLYEPSKCLFWLSCSTATKELESLKDKIDRLMKWNFHLSENKIVQFLFYDSVLWLEEYLCERYHTIEEVYQMLFSRLERNVGKFKGKYINIYINRIIVSKYIEAGNHFFYPNLELGVHGGRCYVKIKFTRTEATWQIELESPDKRKATVILSDDYDVLNVFEEGCSLTGFLGRKISVGDEEYYTAFDKLNRLLEERANWELDQPILSEDDYEVLNQFIEEKFNFSLNHMPKPTPPDKPLLQMAEDSQVERIIQRRSNETCKILIRSYEVKSFFPNGKRSLGQVISLYEPQTGLFLWTYELYMNELCFRGPRPRFYDPCEKEQFLSCYYLDCSEDKITVFVLYPLSPIRPSMRVKESCERYDSFEEANAMLFSTLENKLDEIEQGQTYKWFRQVPLWKYMAIDFIFPVGLTHHSMLVPKITSIRRADDNWQITLENFRKKKATLILSDDYEVLDVRGKGVKKSE